MPSAEGNQSITAQIFCKQGKVNGPEGYGKNDRDEGSFSSAAHAAWPQLLQTYSPLISAQSKHDCQSVLTYYPPQTLLVLVHLHLHLQLLRRVLSPDARKVLDVAAGVAGDTLGVLDGGKALEVMRAVIVALRRQGWPLKAEAVSAT